MSSEKLTETFDGSLFQPHWQGVFQVWAPKKFDPFDEQYGQTVEQATAFSFWDGFHWYFPAADADLAKWHYEKGMTANDQTPFFRGLAENPIRKNMQLAWPFPLRAPEAPVSILAPTSYAMIRQAEKMEGQVLSLIRTLVTEPLADGAKLYATEDQVVWSEGPGGRTVDIKLRFKPND